MEKLDKIPMISVLGAGRLTSGADSETLEIAEETGRLLAQRGYGVVCGGMKGVMEAVCKGAYEAGGFTVGILPELEHEAANPYCRLVIPTGMGQARNMLVVLSGLGAIAISGKGGTLSEIGHALKAERPVVSLKSWDLPGVTQADTPAKAVDLIIKAVEAKKAQKA